MSEIFTEQLTAVTSLVLAVFAIVAAIVAGRALRAQNRQLGIELAERRREAEDRRREQAVQVYVWQTPPTIRHSIDAPSEKSIQAILVNSSPLPIFAVKIGFTRMTSQVPWGGLSVREAPLMPGDHESELAYWPTDLDLDDLVAVAFFRDRAGVSWVTYADGRLDLQNPPPGPAPGWARRLKTWVGCRFSAAVAWARSGLATVAGLTRAAEGRQLPARPRRGRWSHFPHHGEAEAVVPQGRMLDRAEAADRLNLSVMTIRRLGAAGLLEEVRVGRRAIRITEQSVDRHLAERQVYRGGQAVSAA